MEYSFFTGIETPRGSFYFNFIRIFTVSGIRYFITVIDDKIKSYLFYMEKVDDTWTIIEKQKVPNWILELERQLEKAIIDNDKESANQHLMNNN